MVLGFAHPHNSHTNQMIVRYFCPFAKAVKTVGNKTQGREISCQQPCTPTSKKNVWTSNMNIKQKGTKKASWKGGLHRKVHTRVWTTNCQAYEPLYFFCDGSNGQYVALARHTFIGQYDTPWHHHTSHHRTWHHHRRTAQGCLTQKNLEEPSVTLPRPNWSDQYNTTTPKLKSSLVPYRTCYHTHWVWMISMFEFVMACLSACRVWKISSSGNFECWQSGRRFLGSCKQPVIRPSMPWACRRKRCLRGYPLQDRFPWIVFTYSFSSSILMFFWWPPVRLACLGHAVRKVVASKTPYQDRDGAILPLFLFFLFLVRIFACSEHCTFSGK